MRGSEGSAYTEPPSPPSLPPRRKDCSACARSAAFSDSWREAQAARDARKRAATGGGEREASHCSEWLVTCPLMRLREKEEVKRTCIEGRRGTRGALRAPLHRHTMTSVEREDMYMRSKA